MVENFFFFAPVSEKEARLKNALVLAFLGDTVWDLLVRGKLLSSMASVNTLHREAVTKVNAGAQALALERILPCLSPSEAEIVRRGQNTHNKHNAPKNQDPKDYHKATGLEALLGYLYLTGQHSRILELFDISVSIP